MRDTARNSQLVQFGAVQSIDDPQYKDAEKIQIKVFEYMTREKGGDHPDTLIGANNLSELYRIQGKYKQAEAISIHLCNTSARVLGAEHPDTLYRNNNLAKVYPDRVKIMKEEFMEAQLAIKEWRPFQ